MIDDSDPVVRGLRARFEEISTAHRARVAEVVTQYEDRAEAAAKYQEDVARREAEFREQQRLAAERQPQDWVGRQQPRRPVAASEDGSETGYYSGSWLTK